MKKLALLTLSLILTGCASYTSKIQTPGGTFALPKDAKFTYLEFKQPIILTNGVVAMQSLIISNGTFSMNPAVIDAKTAHDVSLIQATISGIESLGKTAVTSAVK